MYFSITDSDVKIILQDILALFIMFPCIITFGLGPFHWEVKVQDQQQESALRWPVQFFLSQPQLRVTFIYDLGGALLIPTNTGEAALDYINSLTAWYFP